MVSRYRKRLLEKEVERLREGVPREVDLSSWCSSMCGTHRSDNAQRKRGWAPLANLTLALSLTLPATNMCKRTQSQETSLAPPHFSTEESEDILADEQP